jgi:hypothetical protein
VTDSAIIEAAARALHDDENIYLWVDSAAHYRNIASTVLMVAYPLIRAAALEEAAKVAEENRYFGLISEKVITGPEIAAAIRALKEQP